MWSLIVFFCLKIYLWVLPTVFWPPQLIIVTRPSFQIRTRYVSIDFIRNFFVLFRTMVNEANQTLSVYNENENYLKNKMYQKQRFFSINATAYVKFRWIAVNIFRVYFEKTSGWTVLILIFSSLRFDVPTLGYASAFFSTPGMNVTPLAWKPSCLKRATDTSTLRRTSKFFAERERKEMIVSLSADCPFYLCYHLLIYDRGTYEGTRRGNTRAHTLIHTHVSCGTAAHGFDNEVARGS